MRCSRDAGWRAIPKRCGEYCGDGGGSRPVGDASSDLGGDTKGGGKYPNPIGAGRQTLPVSERGMDRRAAWPS